MADRARDERFMRRALELARRGEGSVEPNPMVGCVIVRDGEVLAEGWHEEFGGPHAEIVALQQADKTLLRGATAYVTLEPCCHQGKTPPCSKALIYLGHEPRGRGDGGSVSGRRWRRLPGTAGRRRRMRGRRAQRRSTRTERALSHADRTRPALGDCQVGCRPGTENWRWPTAAAGSRTSSRAKWCSRFAAASTRSSSAAQPRESTIRS